MLKWAIELTQLDINYRPQIAIKGQALDFTAEFTYSNTTKVARRTDNVEATKEVEMEKSEAFMTKQEESDLGIEQWVLYVDEALNENGSGVGMMLISPKGHKIHCALCFGFPTSNMRH